MNDNEFIGGCDEFARWALYNHAHEVSETKAENVAAAKAAFRDAINNSEKSKFAFMGINSEGITAKIIFELFYHLAPKTCDNFLALCEGFKRESDGEHIGYMSSEIHRIVPGMFVQGGRIKATGCCSLFEKEFEDESFHVKHTHKGLLGMAKRSGLKNTNESQFYITTAAPLSFLDNQNVVFGRVIQGMEFIQGIERLETTNEKSAHFPV